MNVGESSDDNLAAVRSESFSPTEAWDEAFSAQCTEAMLKRLRRYVFLLAGLPGGNYLGDPVSYAEELVQGAVTDLLSGVLRWDLLAGDLEPHLTDVLRLRVRRDRKRAEQYEHLFLDTEDGGDARSVLHEVELHLAEYALAQDDDTDASGPGSMASNQQRLRELVSEDPLAQRFLDAIDDDATTRAQIMKVAGLTRAEYHNTRRRLARLLTELNGSCTPAKDNEP